MRCVVIRSGSHGLVGDIREYTGKPEDMPSSIVPVDELEDVSAVELDSQPEAPSKPPETTATAAQIRATVLRKAAESLDTTEDVNWTESGQVSMGPLNTKLQEQGQEHSTRSEFRNLLPNFMRGAGEE